MNKMSPLSSAVMGLDTPDGDVTQSHIPDITYEVEQKQDIKMSIWPKLLQLPKYFISVSGLDLREVGWHS